MSTSISSPSSTRQSGTYLLSANAERLQKLSDAIHELHLAARDFERTAPHTWANALAGAALDGALNHVKALQASGAR